MRRIRADLIRVNPFDPHDPWSIAIGMSQNVTRLCAVITEETVDAARAAIRQAAPVADLVEIRLDYLRDFDFAGHDHLRALLQDRPLPVIITCRSTSEGGKQFVEDGTRLNLLVEGARYLADYCDIEAPHYEEAAKFSPDLSRLVVSYHNFEETPTDLNEIYDRVSALPAAVHKIVTRANNVTDSLAVLKLLDRARTERRDLIALAMGGPGVSTRVLGPSYGSFLTYGSLGHGKESAPGQLGCGELTDTYRVPRISRKSAITGIVGSPVAQSASPAMHNRAFAALDLDFVYLPFEVEDIAVFLRRFIRPATRELDWDFRGLSITIPHKSAVIPLLDEVEATARRVGAVNTVIVRDGLLIGYNTDVQGSMEPLQKVCTLAGESCGVIGAGGAARAVIHGLVERGARVSVFARDPEARRALTEAFDVSVSPIDSLAVSDVSVVINTTPVGMLGHSEGSSPVPRAWLRDRRIAYDLVYNPLETRFLADALAEGCQTISGLDMLVAQAALQFELWTGRQAPIDVMRQAAKLTIVR